nr:hypothetical protein SYMBAF_220017 [Serratia symbiotica]
MVDIIKIKTLQKYHYANAQYFLSSNQLYLLKVYCNKLDTSNKFYTKNMNYIFYNIYIYNSIAYIRITVQSIQLPLS